MTALRDIISPELILADSNATSKKRVLEQVAELCANPSDMDTFYQLLIEREKLGSTAVGEGVAIPHCRVPNLHKAVGCFIKLKQGVDFDAPDNEPVNWVFGLCVPEDATTEHNNLLAEIVTLLSQAKIRKQLEHAQSAEAIYQILTAS